MHDDFNAQANARHVARDFDLPLDFSFDLSFDLPFFDALFGVLKQSSKTDMEFCAKAKSAQRCRCGFVFSRQARAVRVSAEQAAQLAADPYLIVEIIA